MSSLKNCIKHIIKRNIKYESERDELIALRNFAYKSELEEEEITEESLEDMKKAIASKNVAIIGGHISWINKIKALFPNWMFIHPDAYKTVDGKMLDGKDRVYFFTDYMNHSLFEDLKEGLEQAIAYEKGTGKAKKKKYVIQPVREYTNKEIRDIRMKAGMTQGVFASYMGVSVKTVEAWEGGRTHPTGPVYRLLDVLSSDDKMDYVVAR